MRWTRISYVPFFWYDSTLYFINLDNCDSCFRLHRWFRVHPVFVHYALLPSELLQLPLQIYAFFTFKVKNTLQRTFELRLKNISIQWLSFTVVVIRFKRHSFFNIFLFRLSIEINEFCSKSCVDITGWTETRLHDSSVWKFIFDRISRVLLRCERVCVYSRVLFSYSFQKTKTCGSSIYVTRYRNK